MPLAGQLKPTAGDQVRPLRLGDGGGDAHAAQGVLKHAQGLGLVPDADLDQGLGRKSDPGEARRVKIIPPHHPHHGPPRRQGRGQGRHEGAGGGGGLDLQSVPDHLVPAAERQAAAGKDVIDPGVAERKRLGTQPRAGE